MPRIRQLAEKYAEEDFLKELRVRMVFAGVNTDRELAERIGITPATMCKRKKSVGGFSLGELQGLVREVKPDPVIILKLLGYSGKEISRIGKEQV